VYNNKNDSVKLETFLLTIYKQLLNNILTLGRAQEGQFLIISKKLWR